jgi:hypothetical protein
MFGEGELMQHESLKSNQGARPRVLALHTLLALPALLFLAGCGEAMSLGTDEAPVIGEEEETCSVGLEDVVATTQAEIEALRGCRELQGSLTVRLNYDEPGSLSLEPLESLEIVRGELWINGPVTTLEGLESLQQVGALQLNSLRVTDLAPLRALTRVQGDPTLRAFATGGDGSIRFENCEGLIDLLGLENLTTWSRLSVESSNTLESLDGLQAPWHVDGLQLQALPSLNDVKALASVREVEWMVVSGTGLERFGALGLNTAGLLQISDNARLTDLDGFVALSSVEDLQIQNNDALVRIELSDLESFDAISIVGNDVLTAVPYYEADQLDYIWPNQTLGTTNPRGRRALFEVGDNPLVTSIILPTTTSDLALVSIYRNASLASVDMGNLQRAETVWLLNNAVLASVAIPNLQGVDLLQIKDNPALSVAPFAAVRTFTLDVTGNLDELAP